MPTATLSMVDWFMVVPMRLLDDLRSMWLPAVDSNHHYYGQSVASYRLDDRAMWVAPARLELAHRAHEYAVSNWWSGNVTPNGIEPLPG